MEDILGVLNIVFLILLIWGLIKPNKIFLPNSLKKNRKNVFLFYFILVVISVTLFNVFYNKPKVQQSLEPKINYNKNHGALVKSFGYSLQAGMICDNLKLRLDTEDKIEQKIKTGTRQSIYKKDYIIGINQALIDDKQGILCNKAWLHFGCSGDIEARLLEENPFRIKDPIICQY